MRGAVVFLAFLLVGACGSEEEAEIVALGDEPSRAAAVGAAAPEHGGTVVMVDGYPVEVVTHASGQVYAWMLGPDVPVSTRLALSVSVPTQGRSTGRPVRLRFARSEGRWFGRAGVTIVPGPLDVVVVLDGEELHGHVDIIVVAPAIELTVRPRVEIRRGKHKHRRRKHKHRGRGVEVRFR